MYQVLSNIVIQQVPTPEFQLRNLRLEFPFLHSYDGTASWDNLTQKVKLTLPKNVKVKATSPDGKSTWAYMSNLTGIYAHLSGFIATTNPVLMIGDTIEMNVGYRAYPNGVEQAYMTGTDLTKTGGLKTPPLFKGFITNISPKLPFTITLEDDMWLLKQIPTPAKQWGKLSIQQIVESILTEAKGYKIMQKYPDLALSVSKFSKTDLVFNVFNFITQGGSLAALLERIKRQYKMDSYFRDGELRIGVTHYIYKDLVSHSFTFQQNIISDRLVWRRKEDIILSLVMKSHYSAVGKGENKDGTPKTVSKCIEIMIYQDPKTTSGFNYKVKEKGIEFEANVAGERHHIDYYGSITDAAQLFQIGLTQLKRYYYDGFKGDFTTFGIPYVKHGDSVTLSDNQLPERNGTYMVKSVQYHGGAETGLRQTIHLDYRIGG